MDIQQVCELWADIKNFEGIYQVSLTGKVNSLPKIQKRGKAITFLPSKILTQTLSNSGYYNVTLWKNGEKRTMGIHRIIAETFLLNPYNLSQVNHKNGIKTDNRIENLEWVSQSENTLHAIKTGLYKTKCRAKTA